MSKSNDLKLIAEKYAQIYEQAEGLDPKVQQYIDQLQIPGFSGAHFASLYKSNDPYNTQAVQALQSVVQKGIPAAQFKQAMIEVLQPEIQAATQQNLNPQQIVQRAMNSPHILAQYYTAAAQKVLGNKPAQAPVQQRSAVGGSLRTT